LRHIIKIAYDRAVRNHVKAQVAGRHLLRIMEFREMRRHRQQLSDEESIGILQKATSGTLALLGDGSYPYAVPISYVYAE